MTGITARADTGRAASTLSTIPPVLFFLIVQRRMVGGLVAGSVKG